MLGIYRTARHDAAVGSWKSADSWRPLQVDPPTAAAASDSTAPSDPASLAVGSTAEAATDNEPLSLPAKRPLPSLPAPSATQEKKQRRAAAKSVTSTVAGKAGAAKPSAGKATAGKSRARAETAADGKENDDTSISAGAAARRGDRVRQRSCKAAQHAVEDAECWEPALNSGDGSASDAEGLDC